MTLQTLTNTPKRHSTSRARFPRITFEYYIPICTDINVATKSCNRSSTSVSSSKTSYTDLCMTSQTQARRLSAPCVDLGLKRRFWL